MATIVHQPPKIEERGERSRGRDGFNNGGGRNLVPAVGHLPAVKDYAPPPASTGIWVVLASITMTFAAFTSALIVRQGSALDWRHLALPNILYFNTLVLIASSIALEVARRRMREFAGGLKSSAAEPTRFLYMARFTLAPDGGISGPRFRAGLRSRPGSGVGTIASSGSVSGDESQQFVFLCTDRGPCRACARWPGRLAQDDSQDRQLDSAKEHSGRDRPLLALHGRSLDLSAVAAVDQALAALNRRETSITMGTTQAEINAPYRMTLILADGSRHLLRLRLPGQTDSYSDGYFPYAPDGTHVGSVQSALAVPPRPPTLTWSVSPGVTASEAVA